MVGSKDLSPSTTRVFPNVLFHNQFRAKAQWPDPKTNLTGKTAIVTGSNTGLGYEAARQLLDLRLSHLIMAVRSIEKGEVAAAQLRKTYPSANIEVWKLDMSFYDSVQDFARRVDRDLSRIDMVLLNAGRARLEYTKLESTGHEETLQVNYLSTMLLAVLLLPILKTKGPLNGQPAHLTIVSATSALIAKFPQRDANPFYPALDDPQKFNFPETYNTSKLLAHMFLWKLVDYVSADGVVVNLVDPGIVKGTLLGRDISNVLLRITGTILIGLVARTIKKGASCYIDALVNKGKESHGCFLMSWQIHPFASFLYTPEGKVVTQRVWDETFAEFEFAGVREILSSMKG